MLSLVSLFFAAFEEAQAGPSESRSWIDGIHHVQGPRAIRHRRVVDVHATATKPAFVTSDLMTLAKQSSFAPFGSSVSVDTRHEFHRADGAEYQAAQQEALHTFSAGLQQGQGPTGNGGGGSGCASDLPNLFRRRNAH